MNQSLKNLSLWLVIILVVIIAVSLLSPPKSDVKDVSYTEFLSLVEASGDKKIETVTIEGKEVTGETKKGIKYKT